MGKGDQRTKKGKRVRKSWGVSRPRTEKGRGAFTLTKNTTTVEVEEKVKVKKAPAKKKAAKKPEPVVEKTVKAEVVKEEVKVEAVVEKAPAVETPKKEVKKAEAPKAEKKAEAPKEEMKTEAKKPAAKKSGKDNLTKIEGIGPKIAQTLTDAGVATFADLAKAKPADIAEKIKDVRGNHVPDTWPEQATLAAADKWDELKELQDKLDGGKKK